MEGDGGESVGPVGGKGGLLGPCNEPVGTFGGWGEYGKSSLLSSNESSPNSITTDGSSLGDFFFLLWICVTGGTLVVGHFGNKVSSNKAVVPWKRTLLGARMKIIFDS